MNSTSSDINGSRLSSDDPIIFLRNEHTSLLGQLVLLEKDDLGPDEARNVLKTLLRDSRVHFNREAILFGELGPKLGAGGEAINILAEEHRELRQTATTILKQMGRLRNQAGSWREANFRSQLQNLTRQFRAHIQHEEKVVYLLVQTRLTPEQQRKVAQHMLAE